MGRAFPERPDCSDVPSITAIEGRLTDPSQVVDEPPAPVCEFPFFDFPPPDPPNNDFGCFEFTLVPTITEGSEPAFTASITYPNEDETGKCQPEFNLEIEVPPCVTLDFNSRNVEINDSSLYPTLEFEATRDPADPCSWDFDFDLQIPSLCASMEFMTSSVSVVTGLVNPTLDFRFVKRVSKACAYDVYFNLRLPPAGAGATCEARAATTEDVTLSGAQTVDGVSLSVDEIVLVKDQADPTENGPYVVKSGSWERTCSLKGGTLVSVREGDSNGGTIWMLTTNDPITVGVTALTFELASGAQCCCYARAATTENITLSGLQTIDGVSLVADEVCLVKNQTTASENGPYLVKSTAWVRTCAVTAGMTVSVREGQTHELTVWMLKTNDPIELDTTALSFEKVRAPGNTTVRVVATSSITLSGLQTIDGVSLAVGDRVLARNQATASQNGIYTVSSGAWTRAQQDAAIVEGMIVSVREGTTGKGYVYSLSTSNPIVVGTTALEFTPASSALFFVVRAVTLLNITLSGLQVVDGISLAEGDLVLVRAQSTASQNGVYKASSGAWSKQSSATPGLVAYSREEGATLALLPFILQANTTTWRGLSAFLQP